MSDQAKHFYAFGPFRLDSRERVLLRDGRPIPLNPKAVETLLLLVENAGHLVDKDELMKRVWPDAFVEEGNLTKNIFFLRKALGGEDEGWEYIETVPRRGYRFVAKVQTWSGEEERTAITGADRCWNQTSEKVERIDRGRGQALATRPQPVRQAPGLAALPAQVPTRELVSAGQPAVVSPRDDSLPAVSGRRRWVTLAVIATLAISTVIGLGWVVFPPPAPRVLRTVQLTHFGHAAVGTRVVADAARLYFVERAGGRLTLAEAPIGGGDPVPISSPFPTTWLLDISPDRSALLISGGSGDEDEQPLWTLPAAGGSPRRLGELTAHEAAWSEDGSKIAYVRGRDLYLAGGDGRNPRRLVHSEDQIADPKWSPSGDSLRFAVQDLRTLAYSLWEDSAQGTNLHPLFPGWKRATGFDQGECCGRWTADGRYFIFRSVRPSYSLWAIREKPGLFYRAGRGPVEFYIGPKNFWDAFASSDGKRLFLAAADEQRELVRYDAPLKQFVPFLSGIPARSVTFSRDRQWVAYQNTVDATLWRSRADGTDRLQLTFPPLTAWGPQWSPDGHQIAFSASTYGTSGKIYLISRDGGNAETLMPGEDVEITPSWSPSGTTMLFARVRANRAQVTTGSETESIPSVCLLEVATHQVTTLPGSEGLTEPRWSPDARYVVARTNDNRKVMLFDFQTRHWTELATVHLVHGIYFSSDSRYVYFQDLGEGEEQPIYRMNIRNRKLERVAGRKQLLRADVSGYGLSGLTPDDSPLATLVRSNCDIYALDVDFP